MDLSGASSGIPENANQNCVGPQSTEAGKVSACAGCPNQSACASGAGRTEDPALKQVTDRLAQVRHKILVLSGKGGVGKSTFACQLAFTLAAKGKQVGLLDLDICGPSVPRMLGLTGQEVHQSSTGWSPVYVSDLLGVMSIGFMLPGQDDAVIWRGPRKNGLIRQFLTDVDWGQLDYLVIDTPPGTSDEHISIVQYLKGCAADGAVVVTTPQEVAMADVRKELSFCSKTGIRVLGLVENMAASSLPLTELTFQDGAEDRTEEVFAVLRQVAPQLLDLKVSFNPFPAFGEGPQGMAQKFGVPFLGKVPLDPNLLKACEAGGSFLSLYPNSTAARPLGLIVEKLVNTVELAELVQNAEKKKVEPTDGSMDIQQDVQT
uniref:Cytosolic Fe-S cluster assembly factor NUBP1 homolog n=1 Tax=Fibrocapsa japonica TaxID=94617 RepID=A0A7S2UWA7_9STRA|mmetsp:Transcript_13613/g.20009  ORF Transcript_13613/g.20009 Transcript_13613/m.20009 type:complete len:375 (+) Transcript_13613:82-1206(+)